MSQASATTAMTNTPPVTFVCSGTSSLLTTVTMASSMMGLPAASGQHNVVLPPPLTQRKFGGFVGLATVLQQQSQSQMPVQAYANYAVGPLPVDFSFRVELSTIFYMFISVLVYDFCFQVPCLMPYSPMVLNCWGLHHCNPLELTNTRHMYNLVMVISPHEECTEWLPPPALNGGNLLLLSQLSSSHSNYMVGHTALGDLQSHPIPPPSLHGREGSSFPGLVPSDDMVDSESVVGIKPGDSGVVIGYQVDEFAHTSSVEQFVVHSHIYHGFMGKVSSLTHFPPKPECEDYSFLDQAIADVEQGLDSILTDSFETLELDTSLNEPDVITSSVSSWFFHLVSTISDTSKLQLALSIRSHKLWHQTRTPSCTRVSGYQDVSF